MNLKYTPFLNVWVPFLPPSSNQIYVPHPTKKARILSDKARRFKIKAIQTIQKEGRVAFIQLEQHVTYELQLVVFFEKVIHTGYPDKTPNRFAKIDLSNRIKLIEDTVAEAIGIDDSHNFKLVLEKHCDPKHPGLYVRLTRIPETEVGLTKEAYDRLRQPKQNRTGSAMSPARFLGRTPRTEGTKLS